MRIYYLFYTPLRIIFDLSLASIYYTPLRQPPTSTLFPYTTLFRSTLVFFSTVGDSMPRGDASLLFFTVCFLVLVIVRSEEHTSELQSRGHLVCRLLLEKKNNTRAFAQGATVRGPCGQLLADVDSRV